MANNVVHIRYLPWNKQCELSVFIKRPIKGANIEQEVVACRKISDSMESLETQLKNNIAKIVSLKSEDPNSDMRDKIMNEAENNDNNINLDIMARFETDARYTNLSDFILKSTNSRFKLFDETYRISINDPKIRCLKLPFMFYANTNVTPSRINSIYTDDYTFTWYKSKDKLKWTEISTHKECKLTVDDLDHYLKLVCVPIKEGKRGPAVEAVSEIAVKAIGDVPSCPFEKRHQHTEHYESGKMFRVVSYNILSERYATLDKMPYCHSAFLGIEYRKELLWKELFGYNADIVCSQEVDWHIYRSFFKKKLSAAGYNSVYDRKGNVLTEGLMTTWRKNRFELRESVHIVLSDMINTLRIFRSHWSLLQKNIDMMDTFLKQKTSLQMTILQEISSQKIIIVGNTHLFYHPEAAHVRLIQIHMAITYIQHRKKLLIKEGEKQNIYVILCGDFNSHPESSVYKFLTKGSISTPEETCKKIGEQCSFKSDFNFISACGTPKYTNYTDDFKGCLDYVFIESDKLSVRDVVPFPTDEELEQYVGLPNEVYPSDHLALVVNLEYKK